MPKAAKVLFPLPLPPFSYLIPFDKPSPVAGCRVVVPWQNGVRLGLVVETEEVSAAKALELRELIDTLELSPFVPPNRLRFVEGLAKHTCSPAGRILASLLPAGLTEPLLHEVLGVEGATLDGLSSGTWTDAATLKGSKLDLYRRQGLVYERVRKIEPLTQVLKAVRPPDKALAGKPQVRQREALELLWSYDHVPSAAALARDAGVSDSTVRALIKKGYAQYEEVPAPPPALPNYSARDLKHINAPLLEDERVSISGGYRSQRLATLLPTLKEDLKANRSVLVLVPEGVLLEETAQYLIGLLPTQVLSGDLNDAQRQRLWRELADHEPVVLVGSYLALLAPLESLGRVVVLEAGSPSYKLHSGPRLFVPTAARLLAEKLSIPIVFTDVLATPETLHYVPEVAQITLPYPKQRWHVTDLLEDRNWPLSADLVRVLKQVEARGRQAILFAPRRGFSAALGCAECSYIAMCPNCDLSLRYHRQRRVLKCHQCGYHEAPPQLCPICQSAALGPMRGAGTEWIVNEVRKHVTLPLYHFDADMRDDLSSLLEGEPGIVVATTALLRHAPLPNVSLIAVTLLDTLLTASDFRAEEEALRHLLQLAELQPDKRPLTLLQTFQKHHALVEITEQDDQDSAIAAYMVQLLERRRHYAYPPFKAMAKVQVSAKDKATAEREASWLAKALQTRATDNDEVLGPSPAPVARLRRMFSYQFFARTDDPEQLQSLLEPVQAYSGRARVRVDVDPRDIGAYLD